MLCTHGRTSRGHLKGRFSSLCTSGQISNASACFPHRGERGNYRKSFVGFFGVLSRTAQEPTKHWPVVRRGDKSKRRHQRLRVVAKGVGSEIRQAWAANGLRGWRRGPGRSPRSGSPDAGTTQSARPSTRPAASRQPPAARHVGGGAIRRAGREGKQQPRVGAASQDPPLPRRPVSNFPSVLPCPFRNETSKNLGVEGK